MGRFVLAVFANLWALALAAWPVNYYRTETFASPSFEVNRTQGAAPDSGLLFLGIAQSLIPRLTGPQILTDSGDLVWRGEPKYSNVYNFQTEQLNGEPILSWWSGILVGSHGYGSVFFLDQNYDQTHEICLPDEIKNYIKTPSPYPNNCLIDKHESILTDRNSIIVTSYNITQTDLTTLGGSKNGWVYDCLFYELELGTNKVLFEWSALKHVPISQSNFLNKTGSNYQLFSQFGTSPASAWDWFHINSVERIGDGYLVNSRYTWSFYVLASDGNIQYTVQGSHGGDFKFEDPKTFFSFQHNARLQSVVGNSMTISIFNNDNFEPPFKQVNTSTGYLFTLDTGSMIASTTRLLENLTYGPTFSNAEGNYQALDNGHALVGYGDRPIVREYDSENKQIYGAQFSDGVPPNVHSYRIYRLPWTSTPKTQPKVVADIPTQGSNNVTVYMSWNGATTYTGWNIRVGSSDTDLKTVASKVSKAGFETKYALTRNSSDTWSHVQVEALGAQGNALANSTVVQVQVYTPIPTASATSSSKKSGAIRASVSVSPLAFGLVIQLLAQVLIW